MNLVAVRDDLLRKVWMEHPGQTPDFLRGDILEAINHALQIMWQSPRGDWFRRAQVEVSVLDGDKMVILATGIQEIHPPLLRADGTALMKMESRVDLLQAACRYGLDETEPSAWWVEQRRFQPADEDDTMVDISELVLHVNVAPDGADLDLLVDVSMEAPRFVMDDFCAETIPEIPVPHQYVESIFLPLARYHVTRCHWFQAMDKLPMFESDYGVAMTLLGLKPEETSREVAA